MSIVHKIKAKADQLGVTDKAAAAKSKAAQLADDNRDKITGAIDKAGAAASKKTGGKYDSVITKAQGAAQQGVHKLADQNTNAATTRVVTNDHPLRDTHGEDVAH